MHFLDTSEMKKYNNPLVNDLAEALEKARTMTEWRQDYMSYEMAIRDAHEDGFEEGLEKGLEEGLLEGKLGTLFNLVKAGLLSASVAAKESDLSEEAFTVKMKEAGYTLA